MTTQLPPPLRNIQPILKLNIPSPTSTTHNLPRNIPLQQIQYRTHNIPLPHHQQSPLEIGNSSPLLRIRPLTSYEPPT